MSAAAWELLLAAAKALTTRGLVEFTRAQLVDEVHRRHPGRRPESLGPVIQGMTANAPGGVPSPCGRPLIRVDRGVYRMARQVPATLASSPPSARPAARPGPGTEVEVDDGRVDIVLVGCVKTKAAEPRPARLLYGSPLFQKRRHYAETHGDRWYVISAEHGLLHPDALLEPYDVALADQSDDYRHAWAGWVAAKLRRIEGSLRGRRIEIHAGHAYAAPLLPLFRGDGALVATPLAGLTHGRHLAWYDEHSDAPTARQSTPSPAVRPPELDRPAESWLSDIAVLDGPHAGPGFTYRWPDEPETFTSVTELTIASAGTAHQVRIAYGDRAAYGSPRRRIVIFLGSSPVAEAVGVDDHPHSGALVGLLKDADGHMIRPGHPVPELYAGFPLVSFADEVTGPYARGGLAVRLSESDVVSWAAFALARLAARTGAPATGSAPAEVPAQPRLPVQRSGHEQAVVAALLQYGRTHQQDRAGRAPEFTPHPEANRLIIDDPFAFLLAVILDEGIPAERAWRGPYELMLRLGHLDPARIAAENEAVRVAVARPPALHRYINEVPEWLVRAAAQVVSEYGGDAGAIWADSPRAADLAGRLRRFHRIGQKKAAMAVEILARDLGVQVREFTGSDIAYDVHVRRVFLRTGLAVYDDPDHMIDAARRLHPERPGELDFPAWLIGRTWCGAGIPRCPGCPLAAVCPRRTDAAALVRGG